MHAEAHPMASKASVVPMMQSGPQWNSYSVLHTARPLTRQVPTRCWYMSSV